MNTHKKAPGYFISLFTCVLAVVSAICYGVLFQKIEYKEPVFDLRICVILAAAGVAAAVLGQAKAVHNDQSRWRFIHSNLITSISNRKQVIVGAVGTKPACE